MVNDYIFFRNYTVEMTSLGQEQDEFEMLVKEARENIMLLFKEMFDIIYHS
jgi:hypothetical protein